jgi:hypothetical protein
MEPVYLRISPGAFTGKNGYGATASMSGNKITVQFYALPEIGQYDYDVELGRFPAGTYSIEVTGALLIPELQFTVAPSATPSSHPGNIPAVNYSDFWWDASESGWGLAIQQGATNELFAAWFAYDAMGKPVWYTLQPGKWTTANAYIDVQRPGLQNQRALFRRGFRPVASRHRPGRQRRAFVSQREQRNVSLHDRRRDGGQDDHENAGRITRRLDAA